MIRLRRPIPRQLAVTLTVGLLLACSATPSPLASTSRAVAEPTGASTVSAAPTAVAPSLALAAPTGGISLQATRVPSFRHIYLIVLENHEYGSIVGSSAAPYINTLIRRYALATNYHAVTHPSLPNYLALFSGSTQGVTDDSVHNLARRNLVDQLLAHRRTFRVYAQNVPLGCYKGATAHDGPDGAGTYARKHEPAISFTDISGNRLRCANILDFRHFSPSAASFELIVPNMCNSMHDCSVAKGDAWLHSFVPRILGSAALYGSVVFITWDEGSTSLGGGGKVATLVIGPGVKRGFRSAVSHTHYSLLQTIEASWGLGCMNRTCSANDMREFFR